MNLTKMAIIKKLSSEVSIDKEISSKILNDFLNFIKENIKKRDIKITGFGTFYKHQTPKRIGRNPKTKESYIIYPSLKVNFKASKKVKEDLN